VSPLFCHRRPPWAPPSHHLTSPPCRSQGTALPQRSSPSCVTFTFVTGSPSRCCRIGEPLPHRRPSSSVCSQVSHLVVSERHEQGIATVKTSSRFGRQRAAASHTTVLALHVPRPSHRASCASCACIGAGCGPASTIYGPRCGPLARAKQVGSSTMQLGQRKFPLSILFRFHSNFKFEN
jgi:hypothetical protein